MKRSLCVLLLAVLLVTQSLLFSGCEKGLAPETLEKAHAASILAEQVTGSPPFTVGGSPFLDEWSSVSWIYAFLPYYRNQSPNKISSNWPYKDLMPYNGKTYYCDVYEVAKYQLGYAQDPQVLYVLGEPITMIRKGVWYDREGVKSTRVIEMATTDTRYKFWGFSIGTDLKYPPNRLLLNANCAK